jgi:general secretion pathway protein M
MKTVRLGEFLNRLSRRERMILLAGAFVAAGFGLWGLYGGATWYHERMIAMDRQIQEKSQDRVALLRLKREYLGLKDQIGRVEARLTGDKDRFSLLSYLESLSEKLGMRNNIANMRPQPASEAEGYREVGVEVSLQNVTLEQAVRILSSIESADHLIRIKQLRMKTKYADPQFIDTSFLAVTYEPK